MVERRKFRRKKRPEDDTPQGVLPSRLPEPVPPRDADPAPIEPLETREERLSRRAAEARHAARQTADTSRAEANQRAERDRLAQEAAQRTAAARLQERRRAEEAARLDAARRAEAARQEAAAREAARKRAEPAAQEEAVRTAKASTARQTIQPEKTASKTSPAQGTQPASLRLESPAIATRSPAPPLAPKGTVTEAWARLNEFPLDAQLLERNRIITANRTDPAYSAFDVLRTRILQALPEKGWTRVAITSPTKNCGKTFTAANLAISLARQENCRTLLIDLDMRAPSLHKVFGVKTPGSIGTVLRGGVDATDHLLRPAANRIHVGRNIAFGFNDTAEDYAAELLQDPTTDAALRRMQEELKPNVVLFDMPPALVSDDVIAFRAQYDAVLLVVGGGLTTDSEIKEVERRLGEHTPLLGMVLNKAEGASSRKYTY